MIIEKVKNGKQYTLSNDELKVGDKTYPIAHGRCLDNGGWVLHNFDFRDFMSGFPDDAHTILDIKHSDYKPYEIKTDKGYSPVECYYKIIKIEEQEITKKPVGNMIFTDTKWIIKYEKQN